LLDPRTKLQSQERVKSAQASILRADELKSVALETLELAEHDFQRASELIESNSVSQSEFDNIEHRYRIAKAELRAACYPRRLFRLNLVRKPRFEAGEDPNHCLAESESSNLRHS